MGFERPLVGRNAELGELKGALDSAIAGRGGLRLLVGEPGIGKSRLSEELAREATAANATVAWGRCWEAGGAPAFWPWVEALRVIFEGCSDEELEKILGTQASDVVGLVPELASRLPDVSPAPIAPGAERFRLFDTVTNVLLRRAAKQPLVMVFEDLHSADPPTLLLLTFAAQRIQRAPILLIGTYRELEARITSEIADLFPKLSRFGRTHALRRLDATSVGLLVAEVAGLCAPKTLSDRVYETTEGNPLFVHEVLRLLVLDGTCEVPNQKIELPEGIRGAIREHLSRLAREARTTLEVAAAAGRQFSLVIASEVAGLSTETARLHLAEAEQVGLISEPSPGRYSFSHVLIRDVLEEGLSETRRTELHVGIANALEKLHLADPDAPLAEIAHHLMQGGPRAAPRALDFLRRASKRAMKLLAYEEAVTFLERALSMLDLAAPGDAARRFEILLELGGARLRAGRSEAGKDACLKAAALARELAHPELLARAALELGARITFARIDRTLVDLLEEALAKLPEEDVVLRPRLLARLAAALQPAPDPSEPISMALRAVDIARKSHDKSVLLGVLFGAGSALAHLAPAEQRLTIDAETAGLAHDLQEKVMELRAYARMVWDYVELADLTRADEAIRAHDALASEFHQPHVQWPCPMLRAMRAVFEGRFAEGEKAFSEARSIAERAEDPSIEFFFTLHRVARARVRGERTELAELKTPPSTPFGNELLMRVRFASVAARVGDIAHVRALFDSIPVESPLVAANLDCHIAYAEACTAAGARAHAEWAYRAFQGDVGHIQCWGNSSYVAEGPAERALLLLAIFLERWEDAERHHRSASSLAERLGARPALAMIDLDYAEALARRKGPGDLERAKQLGHLAIAVARGLGMDDVALRAQTVLLGTEAQGTLIDGIGDPAEWAATQPGAASAQTAPSGPSPKRIAVASFNASPLSPEKSEAGELLLGDWLMPRYRIVRRLGMGGMGEVHLADDLDLGRQVAIKVLRRTLATDLFLAKFREEARIVAQLKHPNIVAIYDLGQRGQYSYIVMEYVEGSDLATMVRTARGRFERKRLLRIIASAADAMAYAHTRGVIHRDLKPANILVGAGDEVKVTDFGIAKVLRPDDGEQTAFSVAGVHVGTANYMAPEQVRGEAVDARTDVYLLGTTLYVCLSGRFPFHGEAIAQQKLDHEAPSVRTHLPNIPAVVEACVMKCLSRAREDRFQSMEDFAETLRAVADSLS